MANLPYRTRTLVWLGDSLDVISGFPLGARRALGYGLRQVQNGESCPIAKHMTGLGSGVLEIADGTGGEAFRVVCATKVGEPVYVIDAFKKKSKQGRKTPKEVLERIKQRLKDAADLEKKGRQR